MEKRHSTRGFGFPDQKAPKRRNRVAAASALVRGGTERKGTEADVLLNLQRIRALREIESAITSTSTCAPDRSAAWAWGFIS